MVKFSKAYVTLLTSLADWHTQQSTGFGHPGSVVLGTFPTDHLQIWITRRPSNLPTCRIQSPLHPFHLDDYKFVVGYKTRQLGDIPMNSAEKSSSGVSEPLSRDPWTLPKPSRKSGLKAATSSGSSPKSLCFGFSRSSHQKSVPVKALRIASLVIGRSAGNCVVCAMRPKLCLRKLHWETH